MRLIEENFPYKEISKLILKERRHPRPYQLIHPWPGRRPGILFRSLILASLLNENEEKRFWKILFSKKKENIGIGKIFLDPFMGSGTTIIEALTFNLKAIGVDINPFAVFLARKIIEPVNIKKLVKTANKLIDNLKKTFNSLYITTVDGNKRNVRAFFWVKKIKCKKCGKYVKLFKNYKLAKFKGRVWIYCPHCNSISLVEDDEKIYCKNCGAKLTPISEGKYYNCYKYRGKILESVKIYGKPEMELFAVMYRDNDEIKVKVADEFDLKVYLKTKIKNIDKNFLNREIRNGEETKRIKNYGYNKIRELFNSRQLSFLYEACKKISELDKDMKELFSISLSKTATFLSILTPYTYKGNKPESMFMLHQYMHEKMYMEINPLSEIRGSFIANLRRLIEAKKYVNSIIGKVKITSNFKDFTNADVLLVKGSSTNLSKIPSNYVDLIVTDPPHFGNLISSGLSDLYYSIVSSILKFNEEIDETYEIIYDPIRNKGKDYYMKMLGDSLREMRRIIKHDGIIVITFRHRDEKIWSMLRTLIKRNGLYLVKEISIKAEGNIQPQSHINVKESALLCVKNDI